jgi:hypothetical protein
MALKQLKSEQTPRWRSFVNCASASKAERQNNQYVTSFVCKQSYRFAIGGRIEA